MPITSSSRRRCASRAPRRWSRSTCRRSCPTSFPAPGSPSASAPLCAALPGRAWSQGHYPERPIRLIVPRSAGGVVDVVARQWAEAVRSPLGSVVIENQGGGGGTIGTTNVAHAATDGYTLLLGSTSDLVLNPAITPQPQYAVSDFAPIAIVAISVAAIMANPSVPARTLQDL